MKRGLLVALLLASVPASALHIRYQAYEGPVQPIQGAGGTKIVVDGVDYWTTGTPPRAYIVIGIIDDRRRTGLITKDAIGSRAIAAKVREVGGDAAVVMDQHDNVTGFVGGTQVFGSGSYAFATHSSLAVTEALTRFAVVKYADAK